MALYRQRATIVVEFISEWILCASGTKIFMVFKVVLVLAYWQPFEFQAAVFEHKMLTFHLQESDDVLPISSCLQRDAYEEIQTSREEDVQLLSIHFLFPSHEQQMSKQLFTRDSTNCYGFKHF